MEAKCLTEKTHTGRNFTCGSFGVVAEVRQGAEVDSVICVCRVKAPQEVTHMFEVKASVTD